jgi:hypothetical protein
LTQEPLIFCASVRQLVDSRLSGFGCRAYIPVGVLARNGPPSSPPYSTKHSPEHTNAPFLAELIAG